MQEFYLLGTSLLILKSVRNQNLVAVYLNVCEVFVTVKICIVNVKIKNLKKNLKKNFLLQQSLQRYRNAKEISLTIFFYIGLVVTSENIFLVLIIL